jgi:Tol biopolymer transport system component
MPLAPGYRLGHYTIARALGQGGMGEVYVAHDAKLNRQVALKVLHPEMAADAERLERFGREAQAVAALNHPNIVTIHSVEEAGGVNFITLELVEGPTLDRLITTGGLPLEKFFAIAIPLADAVAAAHGRGIAHRDLKPANVMVTPDDRVKVLDFGLAKLLDPSSADPGVTALAGEHLTGEGKIVGTAAYMSPEQAEGRPLDHRTDVFSLGVMLYEMATGERPFKGDTQLSVLSAIVRDTPKSVTDLNARVPRHLGRIIRKALEKNVSRRYQTALDLRNDLDELKHEIDSGELVMSADSVSDQEVLRLPAKRSRKGTAVLLGTVTALLLAIAGVAWWRGWLTGAEPTPTIAVKALTSTGTDFAPTISPDGEWIAYTRGVPGRSADIFLQSLGDRTAVQLTHDLGPVGNPAFSSDGTQIAFCSLVRGGAIYVMGRMGGNVRRLTERGFNPSWSPDASRIVFGLEPVSGNPYTRNSGDIQLVIVDVATGKQTETGIQDAVQPAWSPRGRRIAFWGLNNQANRDIYTAAADGTGGGKPVAITNDEAVDFSPIWSPDGQWLYFASTRGGPMGIWRVRVDEQTGERRGEPQQLTAGGPSITGHLSFSRDGQRLVYHEALVQSRIDAADFDPASLKLSPARTTLVKASRQLLDLEVSPDGEWLVYRTGDARQDIYIARSDGSGERQVTDDAAKDWRPRWSPDGRRLAFYSNASGNYQIWVANRDGSGRMRLTNVPTGRVIEPVWSPDGSEIIFLAPDVATFIVKSSVPFEQQTPRAVPPMTVNGSVFPFRPADWSGATGKIAGSGVTLYSPSTGRFESVVAGNIVNYPRWTADGRQVYYRRGPLWQFLATQTKVERATDVPAAVDFFRLSPDGRRGYVLDTTIQSDIWLLTIK